MISPRPFSSFLFLSLSLLALAIAPLRAATLVIDTTNSAIDDVVLSRGSPSNTTLGSAQVMGAYYDTSDQFDERSVIRFRNTPLAALYAQHGANLVIDSLSFSFQGYYGDGGMMSLFLMPATDAGWTESGANWNRRAVGVSWSGGPGLLNTDLGTALASFAVTSETSSLRHAFVLTGAAATSAFNAMMGSNPGFLIDCSATSASTMSGWTFRSSEYLPAEAPVLTVQYHIVPEPAGSAAVLGLGALVLTVARRRRGSAK